MIVEEQKNLSREGIIEEVAHRLEETMLIEGRVSFTIDDVGDILCPLLKTCGYETIHDDYRKPTDILIKKGYEFID